MLSFGKERGHVADRFDCRGHDCVFNKTVTRVDVTCQTSAILWKSGRGFSSATDEDVPLVFLMPRFCVEKGVKMIFVNELTGKVRIPNFLRETRTGEQSI